MKTIVQIATFSLALSVAGCAHQTATTNSGFTDDDEKDTVAPRLCTPATTEAAPADGRLAHHNAKGDGLEFPGQIIAYPPGDPSAPKVETSAGVLHITAGVAVTEKPQYVGVTLTFPKCLDASRFTGVRFTLRGAYAGCSMQYATKDVGHADRYTKSVYASGSRDAYPPQAMFEPTQVGPTAQTIQIPFTEKGIRGNPPLPIDTSKLTEVLWQLTVSPSGNIVDGTTRCTADLYIDEVGFY